MRIKVKIQKKTLPNGIKIVNIIDPATEISVVSGWFKAGIINDPPGKEGLAHLMEHLFLLGPDKDKIKRREKLELNGILYNGRTNKMSTVYYQIQPVETTIRSLNFLLESLSKNAITNKDLTNEKISVLNEKNDYTGPYNDLLRLSDQILWPRNPMARDATGSENSLNSITLKDVNEFYEKNYRPNNLTILVISNSKIENFPKIVSKYFRGKHDSNLCTLKKKFNYPPPIHRKTERIKYHQSNISIAFRAPSIDLDKDKLTHFLFYCLADNRTSILIKKLRVEKNYTYWVEGEVFLYPDTGNISFFYTCDKKNEKKSLELALELIEKTKKRSWWKSVLKYYKTAYYFNFLRKYSDPYEQMWWYGWQAILEENIVSLEDHLKAIKKLTPEKMARLCQKIFHKKNRAVAVIGPI